MPQKSLPHSFPSLQNTTIPRKMAASPEWWVYFCSSFRKEFLVLTIPTCRKFFPIVESIVQSQFCLEWQNDWDGTSQHTARWSCWAYSKYLNTNFYHFMVMIRMVYSSAFFTMMKDLKQLTYKERRFILVDGSGASSPRLSDPPPLLWASDKGNIHRRSSGWSEPLTSWARKQKKAGCKGWARVS